MTIHIVQTQAEADAIAEPKALWYDAERIVIYTGDDIPQQPSVIEVTAWKLRKAFNQLGLRASVESAVANSGNQDLIDGWEHEPHFHSDNPLVLEMGAAINKTADEVREIFALAVTL